MANQTGTATDYQNLLSLLQTFANANGWTTERYTDSAEDELILRGDGGASDQIYVGIKTYSAAGPGYYNWECRGFTGFDSGQPFENQPGVCPATYVPLQNATMTYWFWVTGRRICAIIKTGSAYQFMYLGFINAYGTSSEWPYPLLIMGSTHASTTVFNSNRLDYASSVNPGGTSTAWIRFVDGTWFPVYNFTGTSSESHLIDGLKVSVWPMCTAAGTYTGNNVQYINTNSFRDLFCSAQQGGTPISLIFRTENNGGTAQVPLLPTVLFTMSPSTQVLGEIHNLYWTTLTNGVTAEDVVTDGVTLDEYIVFGNIHRTDPWCGLAIKDE